MDQLIWRRTTPRGLGNRTRRSVGYVGASGPLTTSDHQ
jgi:hypothetical protein